MPGARHADLGLVGPTALNQDASRSTQRPCSTNSHGRVSPKLPFSGPLEELSNDGVLRASRRRIFACTSGMPQTSPGKCAASYDIIDWSDRPLRDAAEGGANIAMQRPADVLKEEL